MHTKSFLQKTNHKCFSPIPTTVVFDSRSHVPLSLFWLKIWVQAPCSAAAVSSCSVRPLGCVHTAPTEALVGQLAYSRTTPVSPWSRQAVIPQPVLRSPIHPPVLLGSLLPMACLGPWEIKSVSWYFQPSAGWHAADWCCNSCIASCVPVCSRSRIPALWACDSMRSGMGWLEVHKMWLNRQLAIFCLLNVF